MNPRKLVLLLAVVLVTLPAAAADRRDIEGGSDWPTFLGPTGDGKSPETGLLLKWPGGGPPLVWHVAAGEGYSMASVADGRLFFFDRDGDEARLRCLDPESGEERWKTSYPSVYEDYYGYSTGPRASPVVDGGRVFTFGVEGVLRAWSVTDGKLLWSVDTFERYGVVQNFFGVGSTPVVEGGLLIVPIGGSPPGSPKIHTGEVRGNGTAIVAFDKATGAEKHRLGDELASYASPVLVDLGGRRRGFHFARGGLMAFDPVAGKLESFFPWKARVLESVHAANPVVVGDTVFITETYGPGAALLRVTGEGFEVVWKDPPRPKSLASHWSTPLYHEGHLYGSSGRNSGDAALRCIDHRTGEVKWSQPELTRSTLLYVDGRFVVLTEYGRLVVIEATPEAYRPLSDLDLGVASRPEPDRGAKEPLPEAATEVDGTPRLRYPAWNAPILAQGLLYVRGRDRLLCFDLVPGYGVSE
jgi:outer membrane protein assembly factor BamB